MKSIKRALLLCSLILIGSTLNAQPFNPQLLYPKEGKRIESITNYQYLAQTYDNLGNYYVCYSFKGTFILKGQSFEGIPNKNTTNYLLIKFNINGDIVWTKQFLTQIYSLTANNGELYLAGFPDTNFTIAPSFKDSITFAKVNSFVAQLDSLGNMKWLVNGGGSNNSYFNQLTCNGQNVFISFDLNDSLLIETPFQNQLLVTQNQRKTGIIKLDKLGNFVWSRINQTGTNPIITEMIATSNNVFFAGYYTGTFSMQTTNGPTPNVQEYPNSFSLFIGCYDMNGMVIWLNRLRPSSSNLPKLAADIFTNELYVSGNMGNQLSVNNTIIFPSAWSNDIYLLKFSSLGNLSWGKNITSSNSKTINHISVGASGIYLAGSFIFPNTNSPINFGDPSHPENYISRVNPSSTSDGFIASYKPNGNLNYTRQVIGVGNEQCNLINEKDSQNINCLTQCQSRVNTFFNHPFYPNFTGRGADNDLYLWKLNKDGIIQKVESCQTLKDGASEVLCSKTDSIGNLYVAGYFNANILIGDNRIVGDLGEDGFIMKYNKQGKLVWYKVIGGNGNDRINDIAIQGNKIYLIGNFSQTIVIPSEPGQGQNLTLSATGNLDVFCTSLDTSGRPLWAIKLSGSGNDKGISISHHQDKLYLGGSFENTLFLGTTNLSLVSAGGIDGFIACLQLTGEIVWGRRMGGSNDDEVLSIHANHQGIYSTGYFSGLANFSTPSTPFQNIIVSEGSTDGFVSAFSLAGNLQWQKRFGGNLQDVGNSITASGQRLYISGYFTNYAGFNAVGDTTSHYITAAYASQDGLVAAYTLGGENLWQRRMGGRLPDMTKEITYHQHRLYMCGYYYNNFSYGRFAADTTPIFTAEKHPHPFTNHEDAFVSILDTLGNIVWSTRAGGYFKDRANTLTCFKNQVSIGGYYSDSANFNQPSNYATNKVLGGLSTTTKAFITNYLPLIESSATDSVYCSESLVKYEVQQQVQISDSTFYTIELGNDSSYFNTPIQLSSWYAMVPETIQFYLPASLSENLRYKIRAVCHTTIPGISESPNWFSIIRAKSPITADTQSFCYIGKVLNLKATGNQLKWHDSDSSNQVLTAEQALENHKYYYVSQVDRTCTSLIRSKVLVQLKTAEKPSGDSLQYFCYLAKIKDLAVFGSNLNWYQESTNGSLLNTNQDMVHLKPYYISQTIEDCESKERLKVQGSITQIDTRITKTDSSLLALNNYTAYQWLNCDSSFAPISQATNSLFTPRISGNYAVKIIQNQCIDTSGCFKITLPSVGSKEIHNSYFRFEPNPVSNQLTIHLSERLLQQQVILYNSISKVRKMLTLETNPMQVDVSELAPGLYFIAIPNTGLAPMKFIKE